MSEHRRDWKERRKERRKGEWCTDGLPSALRWPYVENGQNERSRFATASLCKSNEVAALEAKRNGFALDARGCLEANRFARVAQRLAQSQRLKRRRHLLFVRDISHREKGEKKRGGWRDYYERNQMNLRVEIFTFYFSIFTSLIFIHFIHGSYETNRAKVHRYLVCHSCVSLCPFFSFLSFRF